MTARGLRVFLGAICLLIGGLPLTAEAGSLDEKQTRIAAKVFDFLKKKPPPGSKIIVFSGAADVNLLSSALVTLKIREGTTTDLGDAFAVFVNSTADAIEARKSNQSIMTIGSSVGCIEAEACVIVVETIPKVAVYLCRNAAAKAGIDFDTSFKMLVTQR